MRVAVVDPSLFSPPYDLALAKGLAAQGLEVQIISRAPRRGEHKLPVKLQVIKFYRLSESLMLRFGNHFVFKAIKGIEHLFDMVRFAFEARYHYDIVHLQWLTLPVFDWLLFKLLKGYVPIVLTLHDSKPFLGGETSPLQTWGWRSCLDQADQFIVHTQSAKESWIKFGLPADKINVIPHGHLQLGHDDENWGFQKPFAEKAILLFGIIKQYKGTDLLLESFARLPLEVRQGWRLWIVGKPFDDVQPLLALAGRLGIADQVTWDLRFVPDAEIPSIFTQSEIICFPYREIDASGVFLSSMSYGKPIIATRVGLFAEVLEDQRSALLVERENIPALSESLNKLMQSKELREQLSAGILSVAQAQSNWDEIAKKTRQLYQCMRR